MDHFGFNMIPRAALFDDEVLPEAKPFSKSATYLWLVREARIRPTVIFVGGRKISLEKNQLSYSYRFLAEKFGWPLGKVQRYIKRLIHRGFINTDTCQGQLVITLKDPTAFTREENIVAGPIDTPGDTTTDTQGDQRKNRENIDIQKKEHLPPNADARSRSTSSVQDRFLSLLRKAGIKRNRGTGLLKKWEQEHGPVRTNTTLEKCLDLSPRDPIAWVNSILNGKQKDERNNESAKPNHLGAAADRVLRKFR